MPLIPEASPRQTLLGASEHSLPAEAFLSQRLFRSNFEQIVSPVRQFDRRKDLQRFVRESRTRYDGVQHIACVPDWSLIDVSLREVLQSRSTLRVFDPSSLEKVLIDTLMSASYGLRPTGHPSSRFVPGTGGIYPLELYILNRSISSLPNGLLHFDPVENRWDVISELPQVRVQEILAEMLPGELHVPAQSASAWLAITAQPFRLTTKYGPRGWRFLHYDVGVLVQQLYTIASAIGLGVWPIGNIIEDVWAEISKHDLSRQPIMTSLAIGRRP